MTMRAVAFLGLFLALLGCTSKKPPTWAPDVIVESPAPREAGPVKITTEGRLKLTQIASEYYDPNLNANRAALADKYFGKYWELDLAGEPFFIEEDHISSYVMFFVKTHISLTFRDKRDLLKWEFKGKMTGPTLVIGKAVSATAFEDCYVP